MGAVLSLLHSWFTSVLVLVPDCWVTPHTQTRGLKQQLFYFFVAVQSGLDSVCFAGGSLCGTVGGWDPSPISLHGGGRRLSASREAPSSQALSLPPRRSRARLGGRSCSRGAHLRAPGQVFKTLPSCPLQLLPVSYSCSQRGFWQGSSAVAVSTACTPSPFPLVGPRLSRRCQHHPAGARPPPQGLSRPRLRAPSSSV